MATTPATPAAPAAAEAPSVGLVTWDAEGTEGGRFHSRTLSVPSDSSGLTIGRGYDMKERSAATLATDLSAAGVPAADAARISKAAGLSGAAARTFIADQQLGSFEISKVAQVALFMTTYNALKADVARICAKPDVVAAFGACDLAKTDRAIVDILVDLRFRGDYTGTSRGLVQKAAAKNDLAGFATALQNPANWPNVPRDRFNRRAAFLASALAPQKK